MRLFILGIFIAGVFVFNFQNLKNINFEKSIEIKKKANSFNRELFLIAQYASKQNFYWAAKRILKYLKNKSNDQILLEKSKFMLIEIEFRKKHYKKALKGYRDYIKSFPFGELVRQAYKREGEIIDGPARQRQ